MDSLKMGKVLRVAALTTLATAISIPGLSQATQPATATTGQVSSGPGSGDGARTQARRKASRRARRQYATPAMSTQSASGSQMVAPDAAQRTRDAQILSAQRAQSAEIARQNAITTGNIVKERQAQQSEPRIQDAPGPGSQPLAGDPAIQPKPTRDPDGIQDAPGPAQTLPQAPPPQQQVQPQI